MLVLIVELLNSAWRAVIASPWKTISSKRAAISAQAEPSISPSSGHLSIPSYGLREVVIRTHRTCRLLQG
jgi:hypothetical protein